MGSWSKPLEALWIDEYVLTYLVQAWFLETGFPPHPGPDPTQRRRLTFKQPAPDTQPPQPEPSPSEASAPWATVVKEDRSHQTPPWDLSEGFLFETKNVTSLATHAHGLANRTARLTLVQEAGLSHPPRSQKVGSYFQTAAQPPACCRPS